jgi:hypothetical protein
MTGKRRKKASESTYPQARATSIVSPYSLSVFSRPSDVKVKILYSRSRVQWVSGVIEMEYDLPPFSLPSSSILVSPFGSSGIGNSSFKAVYSTPRILITSPSTHQFRPTFSPTHDHDPSRAHAYPLISPLQPCFPA